MKKLVFALVLVAVTTLCAGARPPKTKEAAVASADPVVGKWRIDRAKGEDVIWTFSADGGLERHTLKLHEKGNWKRLSDQTPPAYQCVLNGGAALIKVTYASSPEHLSMHSDNNKTYAIAKRFELK